MSSRAACRSRDPPSRWSHALDTLHLVDPEIRPLLAARPSRSAPTTSHSRANACCRCHRPTSPAARSNTARCRPPARRTSGPRLSAEAGARPLPAIVHMHGGGVRGAAKDLEAVHRSLVTQLGCALISIDYRLAPETVFPARSRTPRAVFRHADALGIDAARIGVTGESAGGGAALALLARDRGEYRLAFQHLIYPMLDDRTCACVASMPASSWLANNRFGWSALLGHAPGVDGASPPPPHAPRGSTACRPRSCRSARSTCSSTKISTTRSACFARACRPNCIVLPAACTVSTSCPRACPKRRAASATMHCAGSCTDDETTRAAEAARIRTAQPATLRTRRPARAPSLPSTRAHCGS